MFGRGPARPVGASLFKIAPPPLVRAPEVVNPAGLVALPVRTVVIPTSVRIGVTDGNLAAALRASGLLDVYGAIVVTAPAAKGARELPKARRTTFLAPSTGLMLREPAGAGYVPRYQLVVDPALGGGTIDTTDRDAALRAVEARLRAYLGDPRGWSHDPAAPVSALPVGGGSVEIR